MMQLFERLLELPLGWSNGRASGEVCTHPLLPAIWFKSFKYYIRPLSSDLVKVDIFVGLNTSGLRIDLSNECPASKFSTALNTDLMEKLC